MRTKQLMIVSIDINDWAARVVEATIGTKIPIDLVEKERQKIADEKRHHRAR